MGIPLMRTKTWAYAIGAFFGGIAGAYFKSFRERDVPERLPLQLLDLRPLMVILGGMGTIWGVIVRRAPSSRT